MNLFSHECSYLVVRRPTERCLAAMACKNTANLDFPVCFCVRAHFLSAYAGLWHRQEG